MMRRREWGDEGLGDGWDGGWGWGKGKKEV